MLAIALLVTWRSIPARAGEPATEPECSGPRKVYPRACGGTVLGRRRNKTLQGLSPRVRGNPRPRAPARRCGTVYPRACGGTGINRHRVPCVGGLSPRVRGNRDAHRLPVGEPGSIPARAGEPQGPVAAEPRVWVYPRACGGTSWAVGLKLLITGLSPRVRGNLLFDRAQSVGKRSIPARAREPARPAPQTAAAWVYPRACGGTFS